MQLYSLKQELRPYEVEVPEELRRYTRPEKTFRGQCFHRAANYVLYFVGTNPSDSDECLLVHGYIYPPPRLAHAWVELSGGIVFDGTTQRFYDQAGYYRFLNAQNVYAYTKMQAVRLGLEHGHSGPWQPMPEGIMKSPSRRR
jgi:hypothetical protein